MTVPSETNRSGPYNGNGVTTVFSYGFRIVDEDHLSVIRTSAAGTETVLVVDVDYAVSSVGEAAGGQVTLAVPPLVGEAVTILRAVPFTQETDLENQGAYYAETVEDALDIAAMRDQQLAEELGRTLRVPAIVDDVDLVLPLPEANKIIAWNNEADGLTNVDAGTLASVIAYGTANSDIFTGNGTQTEFVLTEDPASINNLDISIGGVSQLPGIDYLWSSGTTLTFASPPENGVKVLVRYMQALSIGEVDAANVRRQGGGSIADVTPPLANAGTLSALASTRDVIRVDSDLSISELDGSLSAYFDANFEGSGSIDGLYGKVVVPDYAPVAVANFASDLTPRHLPRMNAAAAPVVVLVGDSLMTHLNNQEDAQGMQAFAIEKAIRNQAGTRPCTFHNRSIGGMGLPNLNTVPTISVYPTWYTNPLTPWLDYIEALAPDVIVISFGMNTCADPVSQLSAIRNKIAGWAKVPDIVWCINLVPSPNANVSQPTWNTIAFQEERIEMASVTRNFALYHGDGVLDWHRMHTMARDGYDPRVNYIKSDGNYRPITSGNTSAGVFASSGAWLLSIDAAVWGDDGNNLIGVKCGAGADDVVLLSKIAGVVRINVYSGDGPGGDISVLLNTTDTSAFKVVSGAYQIMVEFSDNCVTVRDKNDDLSPTQYGAFNAPIVFQKTFRRMNRFNSLVTTNGTPKPLLSARYERGYQVRNKPAFLNSQLWGRPSIDDVDDFGGSAFNHHSSFMAWVYNQVLGCSCWFGLSSKLWDYTPTITPSSGAFTTISSLQARWRQVGKIVEGHVSFTLTDKGTGSGVVQVTPPKAARVSISRVGDGVVVGGGASKALMVLINSANNNLVQAALYDGSDPMTNGYIYNIGFRYEVD